VPLDGLVCRSVGWFVRLFVCCLTASVICRLAGGLFYDMLVGRLDACMVVLLLSSSGGFLVDRLVCCSVWSLVGRLVCSLFVCWLGLFFDRFARGLVA